MKSLSELLVREQHDTLPVCCFSVCRSISCVQRENAQLITIGLNSLTVPPCIYYRRDWFYHRPLELPPSHQVSKYEFTVVPKCKSR